MQNTRDPIAAIAAVFNLALLLVGVSTSNPYDFEFSTAVKKKLKMLNYDPVAFGGIPLSGGYLYY